MTATEKYAFLWNGSEEGWVLLASPELAGGYCIFNQRTNRLLHIDDDELNSALCARMRKAGCQTIDEFTPSTVTVKPE